uniref:Myotubularin-related protein 14-like n=1 Tax=Saccoglossus kowalevskii TaxID=10224 RepID=A0ABM0MU50_SACKO|nr:PREDICTED: myotubularin-related protein 14-like [Saccoglossus kowalevskii]
MNAEAFTSTSSAAPDSLVSEGQVLELLDQFSKTTYRARDKERKHEIVERRCLHLFAKDYKYSVIHNGNGELCNHYPTKLILLEYELSNSDVYPTSVESLYDLAKMQELFTKARFARCRSRFVIPVLLYEGKQICRSSTLSAGAEIYGRSGLDYLFNTGGSGGGVGFSDVSYEEDSPTDEMLQTNQATSGDWQLMDRIRGQDIKLLKLLSVGYVCDLMVEKKKVKFGMSVTSSEKADKEHRYSDFCLMSLPYPGCEFFKDYKDNKYVAEGLSFDWTQGFVDAELQIPGSCKLDSLGIDWTKYRKWDLVTITSNYLKLFLHILKEGDCGVLIHCISGWDRTPLYISLLRLSLWADGKMHKSLSPIEMLYLTIAYDWLLFGHNLIDRVGKGEEIFFFCFNFLKNISSRRVFAEAATPSATW